MIALSPQQQAIVDAPFAPMAVSACAGSGKTATAVRRLAQIRRRLEDRHGHVALLSFSNVAVNTFNKDYNALLQSEAGGKHMRGVEICTVDAFITSNIIRPHGHLAMGCSRTPFLVDGREPFLKNFTVWDGDMPHPTTSLSIVHGDGKPIFEAAFGKSKVRIDPDVAQAAIKKLASVGAYSHQLGSFWADVLLLTQPVIRRALARRYPHILVDEAQDIGKHHELILLALQGAGSQVSLIGDVNQGIYEFSGATGEFLGRYAERDQVDVRKLEINYRSVPSIVTIANQLSGRTDAADRTAPETLSGAFYFAYKDDAKDDALRSFGALLAQAAIAHEDAAVLCRSADWAVAWAGGEQAQGQGVVSAFVDAAVLRDKFGRFDDAFRHVCAGVVGILESEHEDLLSRLVRPAVGDRSAQSLRRLIWRFLKDPALGLPSASLVGDTEWHPALVTRLKSLLPILSTVHGLKVGNNIGNKLAKRHMLNEPLVRSAALPLEAVPKIRVSTVHRVKGESIGGVLYLCNRSHVEDLLAGTSSGEVGRIGYVALTRACNLFVLGVPAANMAAFAPKLDALGFTKAGVA